MKQGAKVLDVDQKKEERLKPRLQPWLTILLRIAYRQESVIRIKGICYPGG